MKLEFRCRCGGTGMVECSLDSHTSRYVASLTEHGSAQYGHGVDVVSVGNPVRYECSTCGRTVGFDYDHVRSPAELAKYLAAQPYNKEKPRIVCLCGSTKFKDQFLEAHKQEARKGNIVLSVGWFSHVDGEEPTALEKEKLDDLHKRKIDMADEILVINVGGYIGSSTRSEIEYAVRTGRSIRYWEALQ